MTTSETSSLCPALCIDDFADKAAKRGTSNRAYFVRHRPISALLGSWLADGRQVASDGTRTYTLAMSLVVTASTIWITR